MKKSQYMPVWLRNIVFPLAYLLSFLRLVKIAAQLCTCWRREECNKYNLTAAPYFLLVSHNDWSRWFAISSSSQLFAVPVSVLRVGLPKSKITKLGREKYFCRVITY
jgi:hypothetical protein